MSKSKLILVQYCSVMDKLLQTCTSKISPHSYLHIVAIVGLKNMLECRLFKASPSLSLASNVVPEKNRSSDITHAQHRFAQPTMNQGKGVVFQ